MDKENAGADNFDDEDSEDEGEEEEDDVEDSADYGQSKQSKAALQKTRDDLFEILLARVNDITSFTRSKVLQQLVRLAESPPPPLPTYL